MSDPVERLKDRKWDNSPLQYYLDLAAVAARIEQLEAENAQLVAAVNALLDCPAIADGNHGEPAWNCHETVAAERLARAALAGKAGE